MRSTTFLQRGRTLCVAGGRVELARSEKNKKIRIARRSRPQHAMTVPPRNTSSRRAQFVERPARTRARRQAFPFAGGEAVVAGERDHRGIVGAELGAREVHAARRRRRPPARAPRAAAGSRRRRPRRRACRRPVSCKRAQRLGHERLDHRGLEAARDVGARASSSMRPRTATTTAVLSPLKLKSSPGRSSMGAGTRTRHRGRARRAPRARARRDSRGRAVSRSCRRLRPRHRPGFRRGSGSARRPRLRPAGCARPTPAAPRTGSPGASGSRAGASRWPSRWCTPTTGTPQA